MSGQNKYGIKNLPKTSTTTRLVVLRKPSRSRSTFLLVFSADRCTLPRAEPRRL